MLKTPILVAQNQIYSPLIFYLTSTKYHPVTLKMKVKSFTSIMFFLLSAITFLQAQSVDLLDSEKGYKDFKFGQIIIPVNTSYQLDTKRSTKELKAYQYRDNCCTDFKGIEIDGIVLYLSTTNEVSKIEFEINDAKPLSELGEYFSIIQEYYGLYDDYILATGSELTSSFFWQSERYQLTMQIIPTDETRQNYKTKLVLSQKVPETKLEAKD